MRSTRNTFVLALLLCALAATHAATAELNSASLQKHSVNISFPENNISSTSRYHLAAQYDSGYLIFNISTLKEGFTHHHAHIRAVPFHNNSEKSWSSEVHMLQFHANGDQSRINQFDMKDLIVDLNLFGPGPCEKMNPLGNDVVCRFNFSVANQWIPLFVNIRNPGGNSSSLKIIGALDSNSSETPELSWSETWRVNNLIKKADLHVLYNEPKSVMELKWNGSINGSKGFKKLRPTKIIFQSENKNTTAAWKGLTTLRPSSYIFFSDYTFSEKDCQNWCQITLILTDPESPGSIYPVQILKFTNTKTIKNFLIVGAFIAFVCLVVFICFVTRKRRSKRRQLAEMSQFTEISQVPATHYIVYHTPQGPQQPYQHPAQNNFFARRF